MIKNDFKTTPIYLQIRESIYNKIIKGEYKTGDQLPAEDKLAEQFGVSRMTVNKALTELVNKEYLVRIKGSGTFVSKMRKEGSSAQKMSLNDSLTQKGFKVTTTVIEQKMIPPSREIAELLNIRMNASILYLKRLRKVNNEPIVVQEAYLTTSVSEQLMEVDFTKESLYASLEEICNEKIVRANDVVEAQAANEDESIALEVEQGFPVLYSRRLAYGAKDTPIELSYSVYRSDQYVLEVEYK